MVTALASLATGRAVRADTAMTGEISLRGTVLPIGGLKQKALGARRAGFRRILIPAHNVADLEDVPAEVRKEMTFVPVETIDEVLAEALLPAPGEMRRKRGKARASGEKGASGGNAGRRAAASRSG
jgi:ATP-dependent Lon protease